MKTRSTDPRIRLLMEERDRLAAKLAGCRHLLRGTIIERGNICGNPGCRCKRARKPILHGPYPYLSHRSRGNRLNMIYLNAHKHSLSKKGIRAYDEILDIIYRISEINFELLRYHYAELADE